MILQDPILSVPHSGTRSLAEHLGRNAFYHFHQLGIDGMDVEGRVHIPVRHPVHHAVSWICFEGDLGHKRTSRSLKDGYYSFFTQVEHLLRFVKSYPDIILYRMEDLPRTRGFGPKKSHFLRTAVKDRDMEVLYKELPDVFEFLNEPHVEEFYGRFYDLESGVSLRCPVSDRQAVGEGGRSS